jgi:radical SAM protein with 4Fe4S-binding SPASM domain
MTYICSGIYNNKMEGDYLFHKMTTYSKLALLLTRKPLIVNRAPEHIMISPSSICNLDCIMCPNMQKIKNKGTMSESDFEYIINNIKPRRLTIVGPGETFMNKDILDILNYAKKRCQWVSTTSNFTLVGKIVDNIIRSQIDVVKISIDGATKATYEKIRQGANFETVLENIKKLQDSKRKLNMIRPKIRFNYVIQYDNYQEIDTIIELAHELGVDNIGFSMIRTSDCGLKGIPRDDLIGKLKVGNAIAKKGSIKTNIESILNGLKRYDWNRYSDFPNNGNSYEKFHSCVYPWLSAQVDVEGNVTPCCSFRITDPKKRFGNILESDWDDIWNGEKFQELRRKIKNNNEVPSSCKSCIGFTFKDLISINRFLPGFT